MATFEQAIGVVLRHEGGYVNNPNDPGGVTNYGISIRFLADHLEAGDFDGDGDVDAEDIANMTVEQAQEIYRQFWWDPYGYERFVDQTIATKTFDLAVNMGAKRSHILLQTAVNKAFGLNLTVDGNLGKASYNAINACHDGDDEQTLLTAYCHEVWAFYQRLIANNSKLKVFAKGWKNRAYDLGQANQLG